MTLLAETLPARGRSAIAWATILWLVLVFAVPVVLLAANISGALGHVGGAASENALMEERIGERAGALQARLAESGRTDRDLAVFDDPVEAAETFEASAVAVRDALEAAGLQIRADGGLVRTDLADGFLKLSYRLQFSGPVEPALSVLSDPAHASLSVEVFDLRATGEAGSGELNATVEFVRISVTEPADD